MDSLCKHDLTCNAQLPLAAGAISTPSSGINVRLLQDTRYKIALLDLRKLSTLTLST